MFVRAAALAALLGCAAVGASAQSVVTDKQIYLHGETIFISYVGAEDSDTEIVLEHDSVLLHHPTEWLDGVGRNPPRRRVSAGASGTLEWPAALELQNHYSDGDDYHPGRAFLRVSLVARRQGKEVVLDETWVLLLRPSKPAPGALELAGDAQVLLGETRELSVAGLEELLAANTDVYGVQVLYVELWKLGRVLPGGAVEADRRLGYTRLRSGDAPTRSISIVGWDEGDLAYDDIGHYELRLIGVTGAALDRANFAVDFPPSAFTLSLEPERSEPYDYGAPPAVALTLAEDYRAAFAVAAEPYLEPWNYAVEVCTRDDWGVVTCLRAIGGEALLAELQAGNVLRPANSSSFRANLPSGHYFVALTGTYDPPGDYHPVDHLAVVAGELPFDIGCCGPTPTRLEPLLETGDVALTIDQGDRVAVGQRLTGTVGLPAEVPFDSKRFLAALYTAEEFGFGCRSLLEPVAYAPVDLLSADATDGFSFAAPVRPGRYELRLMERDSRQNLVTLARTFFIAEVAPLPGALSLVGDATLDWNEPLRVAWQLPEGTALAGVEVLLFRSAERLPGGALRPAALLARHASPDSGGTVDFGFLPFAGPYEVHLGFLWQGGPHFVGEYRVDRLAFDVLPPPEAPALPGDARFERAPSLDNWPVADDPLRGPPAWSPEASDCVEPSFASPPELTLVELTANDIETEADDVYARVAVAFPGHPYFIEARFSDVPPLDRYRVKVNGSQRVEVTRTTDPKVYRSIGVVVWPEAAP